MTQRDDTTPATDAHARAVLEALHPWLEPAPPSWAPQTAGWTVLAALAVALLTWWAWRAWCRWSAARYRRMARREFLRLRSILDSPQASSAARLNAARQLPALVRRLALAHAPRSRIAPLQGEAWLAWLDLSLQDTRHPFSRGAGRNLADWAYRPESVLPWAELGALLALVDRWIREHRVPEEAA